MPKKFVYFLVQFAGTIVQGTDTATSIRSNASARVFGCKILLKQGSDFVKVIVVSGWGEAFGRHFIVWFCYSCPTAAGESVFSDKP